MLVDHNEVGVNAAVCGSQGKNVGLTAVGDTIQMLLHTGSNLKQEILVGAFSD